MPSFSDGPVLDEVVLFYPHVPIADGALGDHVPATTSTLREAVLRALDCVADGRHPCVVLHQSAISDPAEFHSIRARFDFDCS
jgi:hypothetical protein